MVRFHSPSCKITLIYLKIELKAVSEHSESNRLSGPVWDRSALNKSSHHVFCPFIRVCRSFNSRLFQNFIIYQKKIKRLFEFKRQGLFFLNPECIEWCCLKVFLFWTICKQYLLIVKMSIPASSQNLSFHINNNFYIPLKIPGHILNFFPNCLFSNNQTHPGLILAYYQSIFFLTWPLL